MNRLMMCVILGAVVVAGCNSSLEEKRKLAVSNFQENRFEEAKVQFKQIVNQHPDDAESYYYLGLINQSEGRHEMAIYYYQSALSHDPSFSAARVMLQRAQDKSPTGKTLVFLPQSESAKD